MASKLVFFLAVMALAQSPVSSQALGNLQMGGYDDKTWKLWASLSKYYNMPPYPSPTTYRGGAQFQNAQGHGMAGSFSLKSGVGGDARLKAGFPIVNTPLHKIDGSAQLDRNLNKHLNPIGPETTKFGVKYTNDNGATASFSQTQTHGNPASKTISASVPVYNSEGNKVTISGHNNIGSQQSLGVNYENQGNGASASLTGTQNHGSSARGTAAASIPVGNVGPVAVNVEGSSTFGHGMKPDSQVGLKVTIPLN